MPKGSRATNCYKVPQQAGHGTCNPGGLPEHCDTEALSNTCLPSPNLDSDLIPLVVVQDIELRWAVVDEALVPTKGAEGCRYDV